jgi:hypothetical protein
MPGSSDYSSTARHQVEHILSKAPYRTTPSHTPRPLAGVIHAIGQAADWALGRPLRWIFHHLLVRIGHGFKFAFGGFWPVVLGILALGVGVLVAVLLIRRRGRISAEQGTDQSVGGTGEDAGVLERRAEEAEGRGDHETAVRLRFRAGLLRLKTRGVISEYTSQTRHQLSARLDSPTFDVLARRHEMIVYGREPATSSDATTARDSWPRVLAEVRNGPAPDPVSAGAGER